MKWDYSQTFGFVSIKHEKGELAYCTAALVVRLR